MKATKPTSANLEMHAGDNPNTQSIWATLMFSKFPENGGRPFTVVEYELSDADIDAMIVNRRLRIAFMGAGMPPVLPFTETPDEMGFYTGVLVGDQIFDPEKYPGREWLKKTIADHGKEIQDTTSAEEGV